MTSLSSLALPAVLALSLAAPPGPAPAGDRPADPLAVLAAALSALPGAQPVKARVEHRHTASQGDDPPRPEGTVTATALSGSDGLQVTFGRELLAEADREEARLAGQPDAPTPVRDALFDLRIQALARVLDAGPELLRTVRGAELLEVREERLDGAPARLLVLRVTPPMGARERRYVKEVAATARVWLGPDGLPVAAEQEVKATGRIFIFVSFEIVQRERLRLARAGDRLVATRREAEQRSQGAGEKGWRRSVTELTLLP